MQYTILGNTDIKVSKICLGTMTFGQQNTETEAHEQLSYAIDHEVNFIDTAEMYAVPGRKETQGKTEEYIGTWLKNRKDRDKIILATKITGPSENMTYIRDPLNFSKASILTAIDGNLKRLQTDYVDLYQLHWPERTTNYFGQRGYKHRPKNQWEDNILESIETLNDLIKVGKIRHYGLSNETPWGMYRFLSLADKHGLPKPVSIQNPYNLLNRLFEVGLSEIAIREQVGLLSYSPMAFGFLSGKYHNQTARADARLHQFTQMSRYNSENCKLATTKYLEIAHINGLSLAQMSLAFVTQQAFTTSTIIGATNMTQLKENIDSAKVILSKDILKAIEAVQNEIPNPAP